MAENTPKCPQCGRPLGAADAFGDRLVCPDCKTFLVLAGQAVIPGASRAPGGPTQGPPAAEEPLIELELVGPPLARPVSHPAQQPGQPIGADEGLGIDEPAGPPSFDRRRAAAIGAVAVVGLLVLVAIVRSVSCREDGDTAAPRARASRTEPEKTTPPTTPKPTPQPEKKPLKNLRPRSRRGTPATPEEIAREKDRDERERAARAEWRNSSAYQRHRAGSYYSRPRYGDDTGSYADQKAYAERLAACDAFLKKYGGTRTADLVKRERDRLVEQQERFLRHRELQAEMSARQALAQAEKALAEKSYGRAVQALSRVVPAHKGTKGIQPAADRLAALRKQVQALFAERKEQADALIAQCAFGEATRLFDEPIRDWELNVLDAKAEPGLATIPDEARKLAADIQKRRAKAVSQYAEFLKRFDALIGQGNPEAAVATARQAAAEAREPALRTLYEGKAADAGLMLLALKRAVEGAKAAKAQAAGKPVRVYLAPRSLSSGPAGFDSTVGKVSLAGIELDMPHLKGLTPWGKLAPKQLVEFAQKAQGAGPGKRITPDERVGLGLLALHGARIELAYEQFRSAAAVSRKAKEAVRTALARHATGFVHVPDGAFLAGRAKRSTTLHGVLLGRFEVTNAAYAFYLAAAKRPAPPDWKDGRYPTGKADHPIANVTWHEANAYAQWLGMRLPAAQEWEKAVRGTDGRAYPWGESFVKGKANLDPTPRSSISSSSYRPTRRKPSKGRKRYTPRLWPVTRGDIKGCPFPLHHVCGNVREWTAFPEPPPHATSVAAPRPGRPGYPGYAPPPMPRLPPERSRYVRRGFPPHRPDTESRRPATGPCDIVVGGSAADRAYKARASDRSRQDPNTRDPFTGFRLAWPR